jgi:hypothetical protein
MHDEFFFFLISKNLGRYTDMLRAPIQSYFFPSIMRKSYEELKTRGAGVYRMPAACRQPRDRQRAGDHDHERLRGMEGPREVIPQRFATRRETLQLVSATTTARVWCGTTRAPPMRTGAAMTVRDYGTYKDTYAYRSGLGHMGLIQLN